MCRLTFKLAVRHCALLQTAAAPDRLKGLALACYSVSCLEFLILLGGKSHFWEEDDRQEQMLVNGPDRGQELIELYFLPTRNLSNCLIPCLT